MLKTFLMASLIVNALSAPISKPINATRKVSNPVSTTTITITTSTLPTTTNKPTLRHHITESSRPLPIANLRTGSQGDVNINAVMGFLQRFGYLDSPTVNNSEALFQETAVVEAISRMQRFGGLNPTGRIDNDTLKLLETPRCGNNDINPESNNEKRKKRFIIGAPGWNKRKLTYFLANWSPKMGDKEETLHELQRAFKVWSDYAHLKFVQVPTPDADIVILFGHGYHGDRYPFDGPGYTLAHAYYPYEFGSFGGDVHFDEDEPWVINPKDESPGIDFFTVATHELGHSLGLSHSPVPGSIMFPYYKGFQPNLQLDYDDILAMYQLYISRHVDDNRQDTVETSTASTEDVTVTDGTGTIMSTSTTTARSTTMEPATVRTTTARRPRTTTPFYDDKENYDEDYYNEIDVNAVTTTTQKAVTINYDGDYESVDEHRRKFNFTSGNGKDADSNVREIVPDICQGHFDAVSILRNELFVFKDQYVWRLGMRSVVDYGYPTHFRHLFRELPISIKKIDALYERPNGNIVFFSGSRYWVFNGDRMIEENSPLSRLGLPNGLEELDAAMVWGKNKKTYFFSKNLYWRYDDVKREMDPGYPHDMSRWRGVPSDLDAAMQWTDGKTYFFKKKLFWRFDDTIIRTDIRYPLSAPQYWLGCPE